MEIDFNENYILENDRIKLKPLEISDAKYLLEYSINEPQLWRFNSGGANGEKNLKAYLLHAIQQRKEKKEYPFIVYDKKKNKSPDFMPSRLSIKQLI